MRRQSTITLPIIEFSLPKPRISRRFTLSIIKSHNKSYQNLHEDSNGEVYPSLQDLPDVVLECIVQWLFFIDKNSVTNLCLTSTFFAQKISSFRKRFRFKTTTPPHILLDVTTYLLSNCPSLVSLSYSGCHHFTDTVLHTICGRLLSSGSLKELDFSMCSSLSKEGLNSFFLQISSNQSQVTLKQPRVRSTGLFTPIQSPKNSPFHSPIQSPMSFPSSPITSPHSSPRTSPHRPRGNSLGKVILESTDLTKTFQSQFNASKFPYTLHSLNLSYVSKLTDQHIHLISQTLPTLVHLDLTGISGITNKCAPALASMTYLKSLSLEATEISSQGLKMMTTLVELEKLNLNSLKISSSILKTLSQLPELKVLSTAFCSYFGDEGLVYLKGCKSLKSLDFSATEITDRGLKSLCPLKETTTNFRDQVKSKFGLRMSYDFTVHSNTTPCSNTSSLSSSSSSPSSTSSSPTYPNTHNGLKLSSPLPTTSTESGSTSLTISSTTSTTTSSSTSTSTSTSLSLSSSTSSPNIKSNNNNNNNNNNHQNFYTNILDIQECQISIKELKLSGCWKITDEGLLHFCEHHTLLNSLSLSYCYQITERGIEKILRSLPNLTFINISDLSISFNSLKNVLPSYPNLKVEGIPNN